MVTNFSFKFDFLTSSPILLLLSLKSHALLTFGMGVAIMSVICEI